jgi:hypothetical protein
MTERVTAWQCIGCGRIEGAQPCVGICEDRRAEFVHAADYDAVLAGLEAERRRADALAVLVRQIAHTTPHPGECERAWLALQQRARRVMAGPASGAQAGAAQAPAASVTRTAGRGRASASGRGARPARRRQGRRR